jgi:uncharacterized protein with NAD-binding domain and iron-sulfur cluster
MATQPKVNGLTVAGSFYGYDPIILKIAGTNVATADTASVDGVAAFTEGNLSKAIRAIQTQMSIVHIGERADDQIVIMVDSATANAYVSANTDTDVAAAVDALVTAATSVSTTVTEITLAAGDLVA